MSVIQCASCGASNRPQASYCMRCGKPIAVTASAATQHALAFVARERNGPYFGAFPDALDFSVASLAKMDALISELWGEHGLAPGARDWQPPPSKLPLIVNFGAYLGEVLCRALPARWAPDPAHPEVVIAARVIDAQGRRINTFAQIGARMRDGASIGMVSLYTALTGRAIPPWSVPRAPQPRSVAGPVDQVAAPPAVAAIDVQALLQQAAEHAARGHFGNAQGCLRRVLAAEPGNRKARRDLVVALAQAGALDDALREVDEQRRQAPADVEWVDLRAVLLVQAGRLDEALGTLDMALMKSPGAAQLLRRRAFTLLKAQRWARAQADLSKLANAAEDAELCIGLAHALAEQGQTDAARTQLTRLLSNPIPGRNADIDGAARQRLAALSTPPTGVPVTAAAQPGPAPESAAPGDAAAAAAYAAAIDHARNRRFEQALPLFVDAARLNPGRAAYLKDVGNCLHDLGRSNEAREWFEGCLAVDPGYSAARWTLGVVEEKLGNRDAAISCYRELLARLDSDQRDVDRAFARLESLGALPG